MREQAEKWASFVLANLLWSLFAVPLITMPAATAGVFAVMSQRIRGKQVPFFEVFFGAMRRLWFKATVIGLLNLLVGAFLILNILIFQRMATLDVVGFLSRSVTLFVGLALLLTNLYIWPLLVISEMSLRQLIETSYRLVITRPLWSCGVLIVTIIPVVISLLLPRSVFLLVTVSTCILIVNMGTWPIIRRYIPEELFIEY